PDAWLFPTAARSTDTWSNRFGERLLRGGVVEERNRNKVFHSFRHNFEDALRAANIPDGLREAIMGRVETGSKAAYGAKVMVDRWTVELLAETMSKAKVPAVALDDLRWSSVERPLDTAGGVARKPPAIEHAHII